MIKNSLIQPTHSVSLSVTIPAPTDALTARLVVLGHYTWVSAHCAFCCSARAACCHAVRDAESGEAGLASLAKTKARTLLKN